MNRTEVDELKTLAETQASSARQLKLFHLENPLTVPLWRTSWVTSSMRLSRKDSRGPVRPPWLADCRVG